MSETFVYLEGFVYICSHKSYVVLSCFAITTKHYQSNKEIAYGKQRTLNAES